MAKLIFAAALSIFACAGSFAMEIVTAQGEIIKVEKLSIQSDSAGELIAAVSCQNRSLTINCKDIAKIKFAEVEHKKASQSGLIKIIFTNGDILYGEVAGNVPNGIQIKSPLFGVIDVKTEQVSKIAFVDKVYDYDAKTGDSDLVILVSGDRDYGFVESIGIDSVVFQSTQFNVKRNIKMADIAYISLAELSKKQKVPNSVVTILVCKDGSRISGECKSLKDGSVELVSLYGAKFATNSVATIYFKNGNITYISDLSPAVVKENANYITAGPEPGASDLYFPYQKDLNVKKGVLSLGGVAYDKGLGVHNKSELTYAVEKKYTKFFATIGVDDCAGGKGSVVFAVYADDKKVYESGIMTGQDKPLSIDVDIKDVGKLKLVVEFGQDFNIRGYADWAEARIAK